MESKEVCNLFDRSQHFVQKVNPTKRSILVIGNNTESNYHFDTYMYVHWIAKRGVDSIDTLEKILNI